MNVFSAVETSVGAALGELQREGRLPADLVLPPIDAEPPRDESHGDVAVNAALVIAKAAKMKPRDIAEALKSKLLSATNIAAVDVAGPGFLNITFKPEVWTELLRSILRDGAAYGANGAAVKHRIDLEYVSANPTGPMHVGHCRGAVFGDALASLLSFVGHDVTREYYVNDAGGQVDVLARSVLLRYREALGEEIGAIPEGLYPGDYLKPVGAQLAAVHGNRLLTLPESDALAIARTVAIDAMMAIIREDLAALNIRHDVFFSEASLTSGDTNDVTAAISKLGDAGLIYEGRLERPKGHDDEDWENREQTLFRSTSFGDDEDRAISKSDGSYTYFAGDIAYHYNKLKRGYLHLINVFGADHIGYIPRMKAAVAALSGGKAEFDIKVVQLVKLLRGGEPVKMSKRSGTFITLRDVVDEVGRDPVRFMMLYRKNDAPLDFDFQKVTEQSKDNPVFYVQYAHARAASVQRNVGEQMSDLDISLSSLLQADLSGLTDEGEIGLLRRLALFPRLVENAALAREPHRVAFYLYDLASALHGQWSRGNESPHLRFIQLNDGVATKARVALLLATKQVINSGLSLLGVEAPDAMR